MYIINTIQWINLRLNAAFLEIKMPRLHIFRGHISVLDKGYFYIKSLFSHINTSCLYFHVLF